MTTCPCPPQLTGGAAKIFEARLAYDVADWTERVHKERLIQILDRNRIAALQIWQNYERQMHKFEAQMSAYMKHQIAASKRDHHPPDEAATTPPLRVENTTMSKYG